MPNDEHDNLMQGQPHHNPIYDDRDPWGDEDFLDDDFDNEESYEDMLLGF